MILLILALLTSPSPFTNHDRAVPKPRSTPYALQSTDPLQVKFVTSDIANFWKAYDASKTGDPEAAFRDLYFEPGSPELKSFIAARLKNPKSFSSAIGRMRAFYDSLPRDAAAIERQVPKMRSALLAFKSLYPDAKFPTVSFLMGQAGTGGTTGNAGLLIGAEMYSRTSTTDFSGMNAWAKRVIASADVLPAIVAHELVHYNQKILPIGMLASVITEGSADFIGELAAGQKINDTVYAYGYAHEAELWREFKATLAGENKTKWMYEGDRSDRPDRPADLGYFIGYRISEAYYNRASDKRAAIKAIIECKDAKKLLEESGYDPK